MTLPWPPNWRNKDEYPDPDTTSPRMWAWEYLRRNKDYQELCDTIGLECFYFYRRQIMEKSNISDKEFRKIINPNKKSRFSFNPELKNKLYEYLIQCDLTSDNDYKIICDRYKLLSPDHYKMSYPVVIFKSDLNCIRQTKTYINVGKVPIEDKKSTTRRLIVKLSLIRDYIENYSNICRNIIFERDPGGKVHVNYLRVYDACFPYQKDKDEELAAIIFNSKKVHSIGPSFSAAKEYIKEKYIALAAPVYSE